MEWGIIKKINIKIILILVTGLLASSTEDTINNYAEKFSTVFHIKGEYSFNKIAKKAKDTYGDSNLKLEDILLVYGSNGKKGFFITEDAIYYRSEKLFFFEKRVKGKKNFKDLESISKTEYAIELIESSGLTEVYMFGFPDKFDVRLEKMFSQIIKNSKNTHIQSILHKLLSE